MERQLECCERASLTDCQIIAEPAILRQYRASGASQTSSKDVTIQHSIALGQAGSTTALRAPPEYITVRYDACKNHHGNGSRGSSVCWRGWQGVVNLMLRLWVASENDAQLSDHWKTQNKKFAEPSFITHSNWEGDLRKVTKSDDFILKWSSVSSKREIGCGDRLKITHLISRPPPPESANASCWK
ncbi:hypothetical protein SCHPADRAFT_897178, partial [Schizopora paradoxa]